MARWSPDGKFIITTGIEDGKITVWNAESGDIDYTLKAGFEDSRTIFSSWSPTGDQFAIRGQGGGKTFDLESGEEILGFNIPQVYIQSLSWSPDGTLLLSTGKEDGTGNTFGYGQIAKDVAISRPVRPFYEHKTLLRAAL